MRVLAIIPARGGSKRLPGKNVRPLFGRPLIAWSIGFARSLDWVSEVHVSTDSPEIAAIAEAHGVPVPRLRPAALATDEAGSVDVALDVLAWYESQDQRFDTVALLQPTSPIRFAERWTAARSLLAEGHCDAVIGVASARTHPYLVFRRAPDGCLSRWDPEGSRVSRAQDMPPAYAVNGALYLVSAATLREERSFFPSRTNSVVCDDPVENIDIDTPADWLQAQALVADWQGRTP